MRINHLHDSGRVPVIGRIMHWAACLLGTGLVLLFLAFAIGEGPPPIDTGMLALLIMLAGFLLAWWHGLVGGIISLVGIGCFYIWNFAEGGRFPAGWVFPLCFVPGVLMVVVWLRRQFG